MKTISNKLIYILSVIFVMTAVVQCDNVTDSGSPGSSFTPPPSNQEPGDENSELQLVSPVDNATDQPSEIELNWKKDESVDHYNIQLSESEDFESTIIDTLTESSSYKTSSLSTESTYFWRVSPKINGSNGEWTDIWKFETGAVDLDPVTVELIAPENGETISVGNIYFEWGSASDSEKYRFQISTRADFSELEKDSVIEASSADISDLQENENYYWRVMPLPGSGSGEWSDVREMTTENGSDPDTTPPPSESNGFVTVDNANFVIDGDAFRFAGTNAYYLPNYEKINSGVVDNAFEAFEEAGITVVRMWAFYDGYDCGYSRNDSSENVIQTAPGEYSESALRDLDRVIAKGKERGIRFIMPFVNYWNELGGICQYNTWAGASNPSQNMSFFMNNPDTQKWYRDYIDMLLNRVNTETGVAYKDEPAIFSWQIMNEGRNRNGNPEDMRDWYQEIARFIKSIDSNHLVTTGEDGFDEGTPSEYSTGEYSNTYVLRAQEGSSYVMNIAIPEIDYGNSHWYAADYGFGSGVGSSVLQAQRAWVTDHSEIAASQGKPFVLGEYGHPGWGDSNTLTFYEDLWEHAEQIQLDGSTIWQLTADGTKCYEFGGNICYPGGRLDTSLYTSFRDHIQAMSNSR